jgi:hypothetical protein
MQGAVASPLPQGYRNKTGKQHESRNRNEGAHGRATLAAR